jgi:glycosyl transferase family 25
MNDLLIYVVSLKKDESKRYHISELFKNYSNIKFKFFDAFDGSKFDENSEILYDSIAALNIFGRKLTNGELGCAFSHIAIYKEILNYNITNTLILEDDINFNDDFFYILNNILLLNLKWDCILLGHHKPNSRLLDVETSFWRKKEINNNNIYLSKPIEHACGTYGYLLSLNGAKKLLNNTVNLYKPIDHYTGSRDNLNLFVIKPSIVKINNHFDNMSNLSINRDKMNSIYFNENNNKLNKSFLIKLKQQTTLYLSKLGLRKFYKF